MTFGGGVATVAAGFTAGIVNTIVGSGTLVTFPTLLALGYAPVVANVSNTVGLWPGSVSGAVGYRRELRGQRRRVVVFSAVAAAGAIVGGLLLLSLPPGAFRAAVPGLILLAVVLMAAQPWLARRLSHRHADGRSHRWLYAAVFGVSVYGGYFGAAQGVLLIALLASMIAEDLQRLNALKNVLQAVVNVVAAVLFVAVAKVAWLPAGLIAAGAIAGGQVGAHVGRRLPPNVLRVVVVAVGTAVAIALIVG